MLTTAIKTILAANANLTATVSTRIYPLIAPERPTLPCVVYTLNDLSPTEYKGSGMAWDECTVEVTAVSKTLEAAELLGNYVRTAMNRYTGTIGSDIVKSVTMTSQRWESVQITETGSSTGYVAYAVVSSFKLAITQNISE